MTFANIESSTQDGRPVALYEFRWGKTYWRYTSADRPITIEQYVGDVKQMVTYEPRAVSDNGMVQGSSSQNDFTVTLPRNLPIVDLYASTPPSTEAALTVRRQHFGDTDAPIYWKGTVTNVKSNDNPAASQAIGRPISASMKRSGLRLCWTRECPHFLYDTQCKVRAIDYRTVAEVTSINGLGIILKEDPGFPDGYFRGGFMEWKATEEGTMDRRMIEAHVENTIAIIGFAELKPGVEVFIYPGCDRLPETCEGRFDNIANYGGFLDMPGDSPFGKAIW